MFGSTRVSPSCPAHVVSTSHYSNITQSFIWTVPSNEKWAIVRETPSDYNRLNFAAVCQQWPQGRRQSLNVTIQFTLMCSNNERVPLQWKLPKTLHAIRELWFFQFTINMWLNGSSRSDACLPQCGWSRWAHHLQAHCIIIQGHCHCTDMLPQKPWRSSIICIMKDPEDSASNTQSLLDDIWNGGGWTMSSMWSPSLNFLIFKSFKRTLMTLEWVHSWKCSWRIWRLNHLRCMLDALLPKVLLALWLHTSINLFFWTWGFSGCGSQNYLTSLLYLTLFFFQIGSPALKSHMFFKSLTCWPVFCIYASHQSLS